MYHCHHHHHVTNTNTESNHTYQNHAYIAAHTFLAFAFTTAFSESLLACYASTMNEYNHTKNLDIVHLICALDFTQQLENTLDDTSPHLRCISRWQHDIAEKGGTLLLAGLFDVHASLLFCTPCFCFSEIVSAWMARAKGKVDLEDAMHLGRSG